MMRKTLLCVTLLSVVAVSDCLAQSPQQCGVLRSTGVYSLAYEFPDSVCIGRGRITVTKQDRLRHIPVFNSPSDSRRQCQPKLAGVLGQQMTVRLLLGKGYVNVQDLSTPCM
jgi:hypothetical protein